MCKSITTVHHLPQLNNDLANMTRNSPPPEPLINGVQIASLSERVIGVPAFISYKVASEHDVFYKGGVSSISKMVSEPDGATHTSHIDGF